jgi:hypothetical protein
MNFSDNVNLVIDTPVRELSDVQGYCIQALADEWGRSLNEANNTHDRSVAKLARFFEDKYGVSNLEYGSREWNGLCSRMSEDIRGVDPYGMTPGMLKIL